ncbi:P-selectin isoform X1 [Alligator mississippiensis]|uniref:P-selectin isoform X1 n=1 Tax=Alligator mississippiensis TaxID=8496 RepID=UPI002877EA51|nr:P-selectin isoform X1 [Alligator mississippiensis]
MLRGAVGAERECRALHSFVRGLSERSEGAAVDMGTAIGFDSSRRSWSCGWNSTRLLCFIAISWVLATQVEVDAWTYHYTDKHDYTWENARKYCQTYFTDLVAIQNKAEIEYLNRTLPYSKTYYWIGIRKIEDIWTWGGTNKPLTKEAENWAEKEPNNKGSSQDCVEIYIKRDKEAGKWNDERCNKKKKALCYKASCNTFSCSQQGECVETIGNYTCDCYPGFYGPECEFVVTCQELHPGQTNMDCSHPLGNFSYNSTCKFHCKEGFERQGRDMLQCLASGHWSGETPECTAKQCQGIKPAERGAMNCMDTLGVGDFAFKSSCKFTCESGFKLSGDETLQCTASGKWTAEVPACQAVQCQNLVAPENGDLVCSGPFGDFLYQSVCNFSCNKGFVSTDPEILHCSASGNWSSPSPACQAIQCSALDAPDWGQINCSHIHGNFTYNSTCSFSCETGFLRMGPETIECTALGTWTGSPPHCKAIKCPELIAPDWSQISCSHIHGNFMYSSICDFSCEAGFVQMGPKTLECTALGNWTGSPPLCEAVRCPTLDAPDRGRMVCSDLHGNFTYNSTCSFSCDTGFVRMGPEAIDCTALGTWTESPPNCKAVKCPELIAPDWSQINCSHIHGNFVYSSICDFSCEAGFVQMGPKTLECTALGNWTGSPPVCKAVRCPTLDAPDRGHMVCSDLHGNFTYNSTCSFSCDTGFVRMGPEAIDCTALGTWTESPPNCKAIKCPALNAPDWSQINCSHVYGNFMYSSICDFSCEAGFVQMGPKTLECTALGNWTGSPPVCEAITCPTLDNPDWGHLTCFHMHGHFKYNSTCNLSCETGFVRMGPEMLKCTALGTWTESPPLCKAVRCPTLDAPDRGHMLCSDLHGNFTYNSTCSFSCDMGFVQMGPEAINCTALGTWTESPPHCKDKTASHMKQILLYMGTSTMAAVGLLLSGMLIVMLLKRLSEKEEEKKLLNPTSDLGAPGIFTNTAYESNL